ncbi:hypothetical protein [Gloeomargarita sp.]
MHDKAVRAGVKVVVMPPAYSSQTCWATGREAFSLCEPGFWLGRGCGWERCQGDCPFGGRCKPALLPPSFPPYTGGWGSGGQEGGLWLACQLQGYCSRQRDGVLKPNCLCAGVVYNSTST